MKKNNEFFNGADDATVERIAEEFPVLTNEEKDRIFAMSERKFNLTPETELAADPEAVNGVERYRRPVWRKFAAIAAAIAIVAGGVGGGVYLARGMKNSAPKVATTSEASTTSTETSNITGSDERSTEPEEDIVADATSPAEETTEAGTEATTSETVEPTSAAPEDPRIPELKEVALNATDRYEEMNNVIYGGKIDLNGDNMISFGNSQGGTIEFFEVSDEKYPDMASLRQLYSSVFPAAEGPGEYVLGGEFTSSEYPLGSDMPYNMSWLRFMTYDGKLYRNATIFEPDVMDFRDDVDVRICNDGESFYAMRVYDDRHTEGEVKQLAFYFIRNTRTGGWTLLEVFNDSENAWNDPDMDVDAFDKYYHPYGHNGVNGGY